MPKEEVKIPENMIQLQFAVPVC